MINLHELQPIVEAVPVGNDTVFVRQMNGSQRATLIEKIQSLLPTEQSLADYWVVIQSVCDDVGKLIYDVEDFVKLLNAPASVIDQVARASLKLNGLDPAAFEEAKKK